MKYLLNYMFSLILLVILLINFIESKQTLNRKKRDESSKSEFQSIEEELTAEETVCSRDFKKESNNLHRMSLCRPPRKQLVALRMPSRFYTPGVYHRPNSYEVERCDGVCQHPNHKCLPIEKEIIEVPVTSDYIYNRLTKGREGVPNGPSTKCMRVKIEKHIMCGCQCSMSQKNCNEKQVFSNDRCACECIDMSTAKTCAQTNRMWSNQKCQCVCPPTASRECSSGAMFDEENCRCLQTNQ